MEKLGSFLNEAAEPMLKQDGSGPPEHGQKKGPGKGKQECKEDQSAYQKFFQGKLKKYGVKSPSQLADSKKKEFFAAIEREWKGEKEEN